MARVGLIDVDSKIPNLALLKLSAWHKAQGDTILFPYRGESADRIYASVVFSRNQGLARRVRELYPQAEIGGTGWSLDSALPPEVEASRPDYGLYGIDYGLGFTSRGCPRRCPFCVVPAKEGPIRSVATVADMANPRSNRLILLDNNFLAQPEWRQRMTEIRDHTLTVSFTQGLDIRLIDDESAGALSSIRFSNLKFTKSQLHFAFDDPALEGAVVRGVKTLALAGIKPYRLAFFVLVGYDTSFEEDMHRFRVLTALGVDPFIMVYNQTGDPRLRHFARWVNRRLYKSCDWESYNQWGKTRDQLILNLAGESP